MRIPALTLVFLTLLSPALAAEEARNVISVSGHGEVAAVPDMAIITIGVSQDAPDARAAMAATNAATGEILDRMTAMGLAARDVQTSGLNLYPLREPPREMSEGPIVRGYQASNMLTLRVRDLEKLGEILDAAMADGANRLDGVRFGLQRPRALEDEALRNAVKDARDKAELLSIAAGVQLGAVQSVQETRSGAMPAPQMMELSMARDGGVPVAGGEVTVQADVQMVFVIE